MLVLAMEFSRDERRDAPGKRNRADETSVSSEKKTVPDR
jgi:hypothetical protein